MKIKHTVLKAALASVTGLAMSGSTFAWDGAIEYSGQAPDEYHTLMLDVRECVGCPAPNGESTRIYRVVNQSTATPVVDTITDCKGDASGNVVNWATVVNSGYEPSINMTFGEPGGPQPAGRECSIVSDAEGRAIAHRSFAFLPAAAPFPSALFYLEYGSATSNVELGLVGGNLSTVNIDDIAAAITPAVVDGGAAAIGPAINSVDGLDSWLGSSVNNMHYLTCDTVYKGGDCGDELAKAVPVPAFAAAALGLGLFATAQLSNRRRAVKK